MNNLPPPTEISEAFFYELIRIYNDATLASPETQIKHKNLIDQLGQYLAQVPKWVCGSPPGSYRYCSLQIRGRRPEKCACGFAPREYK